MIGTRILDYQITRRIKAGGMGMVYEGQRTWGRGERVAVKFLLDSLRDDENVRRRFIREAEILELLDHPRIVRVRGLDPERDAFVMDFVEGATLQDVLRQNPRAYRQPEAAVRFFSPLLEAFAYAHNVDIEIGGKRERGVVHRDIKPSNIIVQPDGQPKILDFGISKAAIFGSTRTDPKLQMGSVAYMSPEQVINPSEVDWRSDIYALGVNLWELLGGVSPYPRVTNYEMAVTVQQRICREPLPLLMDTLADLSAEEAAFVSRLDAVIAKATAKAPEDRFRDCLDMRDALETAHAESLVPVAPPEPTPELPTLIQRNSQKAKNETGTKKKPASEPAPVPQPSGELLTIIPGKTAIATPAPDPVAKPAFEEKTLIRPPARPTDASAPPDYLPTDSPPPAARNRRPLLLAGLAVLLLGAGLVWYLSRNPAASESASTQSVVVVPKLTPGDTVAGSSLASNETEELLTTSKTSGDIVLPGKKETTPRSEKKEEVEPEEKKEAGALTPDKIGDKRYAAREYTEAVRWYRIAAEAGSPRGQYKLGLCYRRGEGVAKDYAEALKWLQRAANGGSAPGQNNLGLMYQNGYGVPRDYATAVKWFEKAADQGSESAQYNLGVMYENGYGVGKDVNEALKLYRKAAEKNHPEAKRALEEAGKN